MARLALCALALVAGALGSPYVTNTSPGVDNKHLAELHAKLIPLYFHNYEFTKTTVTGDEWTLEAHADQFNNTSAVKTYCRMLEHDWTLPLGVPFSILNENHKYEVVTLFQMLLSAKNFETLYNAVLYLHDKVNESLYVYVLNVVFLHHPLTQGFTIPPIYEVLPTYFNNAEIVATAQRLISHSDHQIHQHPICYKREGNIVIEWNKTIWPYYSHSTPVWYFTHDPALNNIYYFDQIAYPSWLGHDAAFKKDGRGEWTWFFHRELLSRYYMELLSNGLGEIPELGYHIVEEGFNSGLVHPNGIPFPVRNDHYHLDQPVWIEALEKIKVYETRILDVLDKGFYVDTNGQNVQVTAPESLEVIWNLIEANVDSPNLHYYKDFISIWKKVLGNSVVHKHYYNNAVPLEVPSVLEIHQTTLRDPAFYMIWKHVLDIFWTWKQKLPHYTKAELGCQSVVINKVQVDKLLTYFEYDYMNVSSLWYTDEHETKHVHDDVSVLVEYPRLNHKVFTIRIHLHCAVAKKVVVKIFLAPKYDSHGHEIPLHENTKNFYMMDQFAHELSDGESVIVRESTANTLLTEGLESVHVMYNKAVDMVNGKNLTAFKPSHSMYQFPNRLLLPKGRANGMPFVLLVHIADYHPPKELTHEGFYPEVSRFYGYPAMRFTAGPIDFPVDRPLYPWLIKGVPNIALQDVLIFHKHTPEIHAPHHE